MTAPRDQHDLLPAFVAGTLDPAAAASYREHLDGCLVCRREIEFLRLVESGAAAHGAAFFADHPEVDDIVAVATGVDGADDGSVRRHLEICASCATEASWVRGDASPFAELHPAWAAGSGTSPWSARLGWIAAAAAVVVLGLVLALRPGASTLESASGPTFVADLQATTLATTGINTFSVPAGMPAVTLTFPVDVPADAFPATVEVIDPAHRVLLRETVARQADLDGGEFYAVTCGVERCPPGTYAVRITDRTARAHEIPFTLSAALDSD